MVHGSDGRRGGERSFGERWRGGNQGLWDAGLGSGEGSWRHNDGGSRSCSERAGERGGHEGVSGRGRCRGEYFGHGERGRGSNFGRGGRLGSEDIGHGERGRRSNFGGGARMGAEDIGQSERGRGSHRGFGRGRGRGWTHEASRIGESGPSTSLSSSGSGRGAAASGRSPYPSWYRRSDAGVIAREETAGGKRVFCEREGSSGPPSAWSRGLPATLTQVVEREAGESGAWRSRRSQEGSSVDIVAGELSLMKVSAGGSASSNSAPALAIRPDKGGVKGRRVRATANYFPMSVSIEQIYLYSVEIRRCERGRDGDFVPKSTKRTVERRLLEVHSADLGGRLPVFDGSNLLYSAKSLGFEDRSFTISVAKPASNETQDFVLHLKLASVLPLGSLQGQANTVPTDLIQALNIVVREHPACCLLPVGRSLFFATPACPLSRSLEILSGFIPSVRHTQQGLALNLDYDATVFYRSVPLLDFLCDQFSDFNPAGGLPPHQFEQVLHALRGLKVNVTHRESKKVYFIRGLSPKKTEELRFQLSEAEGRQETTVVAFFRQKYNYPLRFTKLPCLQSGRGSNEIYLPMEVCRIAPHQKNRKTLNVTLQSKAQKMICIPAHDRQNRIYKLMEEGFSPAKGAFVREFGVEIDPSMTVVPARVLEPPALKYSNMNGQHVLTPVFGKGHWNLPSGVQFLQGCTIPEWAIVNFDSGNVNPYVVGRFSWNIRWRCEELGVRMDENPVMEFPGDLTVMNLQAPAQVLELLQRMKRACPSRLPILFCIMADKHEAYGTLKKFADMDVGIFTQCCLTKNVKKCCSTDRMTGFESQYLANVILKVNAKLGGQHVELMQPIPDLFPVLSEPTIIFGADVTHPKEREEKPSIAAVVASTNWPSANRYAARQSAQRGRKEIIENLGDMVKELWQVFYRKTGKKPGKVLFFRDGVGEGQFEEILKEEVPKLKEALRASGGEGYDPALTLVLVQKRHHTRLFAEDMNRDCNVAPGTVVDTTITHPYNFDFFLCSQAGLVGTSKPCHYHVLIDEIGFSSDGLQSLINRLCYTYVRCTKAVSYVPPAYYAHLAAFRARYYIDADPYVWHEDSPGRILRLHEDVRDSMFYV